MSTATWNSTTAATRSDLSPRLLRSYRETAYVCCGVVVRIGRRSAATDALLRGMGTRHGGFVTAWNPRSRCLLDGVNRRRQCLLIEHLRRRRFIQAEGGLRGWREEMLLVAADPRFLAVLARRFSQSAIVVLRMNGRARLVVL